MPQLWKQAKNKGDQPQPQHYYQQCRTKEAKAIKSTGCAIEVSLVLTIVLLHHRIGDDAPSFCVAAKPQVLEAYWNVMCCKSYGGISIVT